LLDIGGNTKGTKTFREGKPNREESRKLASAISVGFTHQSVKGEVILLAIKEQILSENDNIPLIITTVMG
jgi:hypothetical protein